MLGGDLICCPELAVPYDIGHTPTRQSLQVTAVGGVGKKALDWCASQW